VRVTVLEKELNLLRSRLGGTGDPIMLSTAIPASSHYAISVVPQLDFQMLHNFSEFDTYAMAIQFEDTSLLSFAQHNFNEWNDG
jgi:hypothetical protein